MELTQGFGEPNPKRVRVCKGFLEDPTPFLGDPPNLLPVLPGRIDFKVDFTAETPLPGSHDDKETLPAGRQDFKGRDGGADMADPPNHFPRIMTNLHFLVGNPEVYRK